MPYTRNNYDFVINSSFRPYSQEEILKPLIAYRDAFKETEDAYIDLSDKADKFKYLSESLPENSKARQIYEGYANELSAQAQDLASNGLSMGNRRALVGLKRRYNGEIGRLNEADQALQKELERRRDEKDTSMLYGTNNLNIDMFLDHNIPNLYKISGNDLSTLGENMGKAVSSRQYNYEEAGSLFGNQYNIFKETQGIRPEDLDAWMATAGNELADNILVERGAVQNLTGAEYARAKQSVLNGIYKGIVYNESVKPYANGEYMSKAERDRSAQGWASHNFQMAKEGYVRDSSSPTGYRYSPLYDKNNKDEWMYDHDKKTGERTGFSQKYYEAVDKGYIKGYNNSGNNSAALATGLDKLIKNGGATSDGESIVLDEDPTKSYTIKINTNQTGESPAEYQAYIDRKGKTSEATIKEHFQTVLPEVFGGLDNAQFREVMKYLENISEKGTKYIIIPGTDSTGRIIDKNKLNSFITTVNRIKIKGLQKSGIGTSETVPLPSLPGSPTSPTVPPENPEGDRQL